MADDKKITENDLDEAINDITRRESDELLSSEEAQLHEAFAPSGRSVKEKILNAYHKWWNNKFARYGTFGGITAVLLVTALIAPLRNTALNTIGVRGSVLLTIHDKTNDTPLQKATVEIDGKQHTSSRDGKILVEHIRLGTHEVTVRKNAFAPVHFRVSIGTKTTKLPTVSLRAVGSQYSLEIVDYLTGKPISAARVSSKDDASANADSKGRAVLTVKSADQKSVLLNISSDGYKDSTLSVTAGDATLHSVLLTKKARHIFASNQTGALALYGIDLDGENRKEILSNIAVASAGSLQIQASPDNSLAAVVSKKDGIVNADGYALDALTLIQTATGSSKTIERGESIQILGWNNTSLVYQLISSGVSAANSQRSKLISYNTASDKKTQLVAANYFVGATLIDGQVYYAVSATDPSVQSSLMQINIEGKNRQLLSKESVWGLYRKSYTELTVQTQTGWLLYDTAIHKTSKISMGDYQDYHYAESADNKKTVHIESRDGKSILIITDKSSKKDQIISGIAGAQKVTWATNDVLIVRSVSKNEIADYAVSLLGGSPKKITNAVQLY